MRRDCLVVAGWSLMSLAGTLASHWHAPALAEADTPKTGEYDAPGAQERRKAAENKLKLLDRLVRASPAATGISGSEDAIALQLLRNAEQAREQAQAAFNAGDWARCEQHLKDGLGAFQDASRRIEDPVRAQTAQRERYQRLRERVVSFSEAFQRVVQEKQSSSVGDLLDQERVVRWVDEADALASEDRHAQANQRLADAADAIERALSEARDRETLLHELNFDSPEHEYAYEKQRNKSYRLLLELLQRRGPDTGRKLVDVQALVLENERLREQADVLVAAGETQAAIRKLEEGTARLARALRASGVVF